MPLQPSDNTLASFYQEPCLMRPEESSICASKTGGGGKIADIRLAEYLGHVRNLFLFGLSINNNSAYCSLPRFPVLAVMMCARHFLFFIVCLFLGAFAAPTRGLPACSTNVSVQPCACHEGTTFQNSTTVGVIGASIFDARTILYSCKLTPVHKPYEGTTGSNLAS